MQPRNSHARGKIRAIATLAACACLLGVLAGAVHVAPQNSFSESNLLPSIDTRPSISAPADITFIEGQSGYNITWHVSSRDGAPGGTYTITNNSVTARTGSWIHNSDVSIGLNNLPAGSYTFIISATDTGGTMTDTVLVTVSPNDAPVINTPGPVSWQVGGPGVAITWVANDTTMGTGTCAVYRNGTVILNATWTSGGNITIVIQGLQPGTYNYTIVVHDGLGCSASSQVIVTVTAAPGDQVPANPIPWITGISIGTTAVLVGIIVVKGYRKP